MYANAEVKEKGSLGRKSFSRA